MLGRIDASKQAECFVPSFGEEWQCIFQSGEGQFESEKIDQLYSTRGNHECNYLTVCKELRIRFSLGAYMPESRYPVEGVGFTLRRSPDLGYGRWGCDDGKYSRTPESGRRAAKVRVTLKI